MTMCPRCHLECHPTQVMQFGMCLICSFESISGVKTAEGNTQDKARQMYAGGAQPKALAAGPVVMPITKDEVIDDWEMLKALTFVSFPLEATA